MTKIAKESKFWKKINSSWLNLVTQILFCSPFIFLFLWFSLLLQAATPPDPSDLFLKAYQQFEEAESLERQNISHGALEKYRHAANILSQIQKNNPHWQSLVVNYRLQKIQENIVRLRDAPSSLLLIENHDPSKIPIVTITAPNKNSLPALLINPEIGKLRWQFARAVEENQRLNTVLIKSEAERKTALIEIDKIKIALIEATSERPSANASSDVMREQVAHVKQVNRAYKNQIASLQEQIKGMEADNSVICEENERLFKKLEQADSYIRTSDEIRKNLIKDRQRFYKSFTDVQKDLNKFQDITQSVDRLNKEKSSSLKISDLSQKLKNSQTAFEQANKDTQVAQEQAKKLLEENLFLASELAQNKEYIKKLKGTNRFLITELQPKFNSMDQELHHLHHTTTLGHQRIAELNLSSTENTDLRHQKEKNELLRAIILRLIKEQTQRIEALQSIGNELKYLQIHSPLLSEQIAIFEQSSPQLTEEEKILFKQPSRTPTNDSFVIVKKNKSVTAASPSPTPPTP